MRSFDFWWRLLRPHALTASLVPVLLGTVYAYTVVSRIQWSLFLAMLVASFLIQTATNLFNEYYDYMRGLDTKDSVGIGGTIVHDGASPRFVMGLALGAYALALLFGPFYLLAKQLVASCPWCLFYADWIFIHWRSLSYCRFAFW